MLFLNEIILFYKLLSFELQIEDIVAICIRSMVQYTLIYRFIIIIYANITYLASGNRGGHVLYRQKQDYDVMTGKLFMMTCPASVRFPVIM